LQIIQYANVMNTRSQPPIYCHPHTAPMKVCEQKYFTAYYCDVPP